MLKYINMHMFCTRGLGKKGNFLMYTFKVC